MKINGKTISNKSKPYFIAEMSNNHLGDINLAKKIISAAKKSGASAIKIQTYTADSLTINCKKSDFIITDKIWKGMNYYELYKKISMPLKWHEILFEYAKKLNITIFSSPFDEKSVDLLEKLNCPAYKVASFEANDHSLIKYIASTKKPIIVSTGVQNLDEIKETLSIIKKYGSNEIALLHCISSYPSETKDMNISAINILKELSSIVGLSDHTLNNLASNLAVANGASIIEKHFTLNRKDGGVDSSFSIEPDEMKNLINELKQTKQAMGNKNIFSTVRKGSNHARSIYCVKDIKKGQKFSTRNLRVIRPGFGLAPKYLDDILDRQAKFDIERVDPLGWELID